jgi:hypothetical protein
LSSEVACEWGAVMAKPIAPADLAAEVRMAFMRD